LVLVQQAVARQRRDQIGPNFDDDVQTVTANFDIPEDVAAQL